MVAGHLVDHEEDMDGEN